VYIVKTAAQSHYRSETISRSDCRPIVWLSADTIVWWDYRPNPKEEEQQQQDD